MSDKRENKGKEEEGIKREGQSARKRAVNNIDHDQTYHLLNQRSYGDIKHPSSFWLDPDVIALRNDDHDGAASRC